MDRPQTTANGQTTKPDEEINVFNVLIVLAKHKRRLWLAPVAAALLVAGGTLLMPNTYEATAKLLPPQQGQSGGAAALLSQFGGAAGIGGLAGLKNSGDLYVAMLKSRTVAEKLVSRFDLKKVYRTESLEMARFRLSKNTNIVVGKDGIISIAVESKNKKLVAPLANAYVAEFMQLTKVLAVTEASQRRVFYEQQLKQANDNLAKVEWELKNSLDQRGVISVDAESRGVIETVGRLRAQVSAKEIQLNSMAAFVTRDNPQYKRVEEELASLRAELAKLENGRGATRGSDGPATTDAKGGFENVKLLRDVKYYQMLYELLAKQYEVSRLDEAKDPSVVQVLDSAVEPEFKSKPNRSLIVALSAVAGFLLAVASAFISEARGRFLNSPQGRSQWLEFKSQLRKEKAK
jgi:uncharacterized protein involved in exopolysaccharide biosynthesis